MHGVQLTLVTIISESLLQDQLIADLKRLGAKGYSISSVHGEGSRGVRASEWEGANVKLETIVAPAVADRIVAWLAEQYFPSYAVIAYLSDMSVLRGDKYV